MRCTSADAVPPVVSVDVKPSVRLKHSQTGMETRHRRKAGSLDLIVSGGLEREDGKDHRVGQLPCKV